MGFGGLDDNPVKGLTCVLSVEQVLSAKVCRVQHKCSSVMVQRLSWLWLWTSQVKKNIAYVKLSVHILETTDQAKDGDKKSFEQLTSWEKVKEAKEPKARGEEEYVQSQGLIELRKDMVLRESLSKDMTYNQWGNIYDYVV